MIVIKNMQTRRNKMYLFVIILIINFIAYQAREQLLSLNVTMKYPQTDRGIS